MICYLYVKFQRITVDRWIPLVTTTVVTWNINASDNIRIYVKRIYNNAKIPQRNRRSINAR